jgi:hypothetical protein
MKQKVLTEIYVISVSKFSDFLTTQIQTQAFLGKDFLGCIYLSIEMQAVK